MHLWTSDEINFFTTLSYMIASTLERHHQINSRLETEKRNTEAAKLLEKSSRLASVGIIASSITHEINQPLNAIKVTADGILFQHKNKKSILSQNIIDKIKNISKGSERINEIIRHMKQFWAAPEKVTEEIVNVNDVVESSLSLIERQMHSHGIKPRIALSYNNLYVRGNYIQCEQIVTNLLSNAIHSLDVSDKKNKNLTVATGKNDHSILIEVSDNGVGVPENIGDRLFDPFYSSKNPGEGMGLGLAIVKNIVQKFHGSVEAKNNQSGGATFTVYFPIP